MELFPDSVKRRSVLAGAAALYWSEPPARMRFVAALRVVANPDELRRIHDFLKDHPDHSLATKQFFLGLYGTMVSFTLRGGRGAADAFIRGAQDIPFCPSLGELSTTLSHPETTSHRGMTPEQRAALGITGGTIRLSVGTESAQFIRAALAQGLAAAVG